LREFTDQVSDNQLLKYCTIRSYYTTQSAV